MVNVRQPSARDDRPPIATTTIVAAASLAVGLWLAHAAMGHPVTEVIDPPPEAFDTEPTEAPVPPPPAVDVDVHVDVDDPLPPSTIAPSTSTSPSPSPSTSTSTSTSPSISPSPSRGTPSTPSIATPRPPPPIGTGVATRARRGRVAYLRCDGAPPTSGPFPCPRDAALEASVWTAVAGATACTPPLPPGQVDLVLDWDREAGATTPAISTRDTFPDDAIRTDAAGVVACLTPVLSTLTTTIPGDRIRVGFRFSLE